MPSPQDRAGLPDEIGRQRVIALEPHGWARNRPLLVTNLVRPAARGMTNEAIIAELNALNALDCIIAGDAAGRLSFITDPLAQPVKALRVRGGRLVPIQCETRLRELSALFLGGDRGSWVVRG